MPGNDLDALAGFYIFYRIPGVAAQLLHNFSCAETKSWRRFPSIHPPKPPPASGMIGRHPPGRGFPDLITSIPERHGVVDL